MFRIVILFILGTVISPLVCQSLEKRSVIASDSSGRQESGATTPVEVATEGFMELKGAKSNDRPIPTVYFDFIQLEEPPPPDFKSIFESWFVSALSEDDTST